MRGKGLLLLVACFLSGSAKILSQQFPFVYYTPKDGLVNSRVRSIKQDSKGRMYFITYGGLSVYDGSRFTNYSEQDGLAIELVNDLMEIPGDTLLVATNSHSLNTLVHGKIGVFKTADNFCPLINRLLFEVRMAIGTLYPTKGCSGWTTTALYAFHSLTRAGSILDKTWTGSPNGTISS